MRIPVSDAHQIAVGIGQTKPPIIEQKTPYRSTLVIAKAFLALVDDLDFIDSVV